MNCHEPLLECFQNFVSHIFADHLSRVNYSENLMIIFDSCIFQSKKMTSFLPSEGIPTYLFMLEYWSCCSMSDPPKCIYTPNINIYIFTCIHMTIQNQLNTYVKFWKQSYHKWNIEVGIFSALILSQMYSWCWNRN